MLERTGAAVSGEWNCVRVRARVCVRAALLIWRGHSTTLCFYILCYLIGSYMHTCANIGIAKYIKGFVVYSWSCMMMHDSC